MIETILVIACGLWALLVLAVCYKSYKDDKRFEKHLEETGRRLEAALEAWLPRSGKPPHTPKPKRHLTVVRKEDDHGA
jgi:hypothetical protein